MANDQNLVPFGARTEKEQREIRVKGGKASGEARRKKKTVREAMLLLRDMKVGNKNLREKIAEETGIKDDDVTYGIAMAFMAAQHTLKGNPSWGRLMFEMLGENDVQGVSKIPAANLSVNFSNKPEDFQK